MRRGGGYDCGIRIRTGSYGDGAEIFGHDAWARTAQFASTSRRRPNMQEREGRGTTTSSRGRLGNNNATTLVASVVAGLASGIISEAIVVAPSQIVKVRLRSREHAGRYSGTLDCRRKIVAEGGGRLEGVPSSGLRPDPVAQLRAKRRVLRTRGLDTAYYTRYRRRHRSSSRRCKRSAAVSSARHSPRVSTHRSTL